jgi:MFS transporter, Spinster family, sphingosine-1-phosphate transporter
MNSGSDGSQVSREAAALPLFFAVLFLSFADQSLLPPLLNPLLRDFFGGTADIVPLGWSAFLFTACSALAMLAAGIAADRSARKKLCIAGCLAAGAASVLVVFAPNGPEGYRFFLATRALAGLGAGAVVPAVFSMTGDAVDRARRASAFGLLSAAMIVGRMGGFLAGGLAAPSWRTAYFAAGLANLVLAAGLVFLREPARGSGEDELREALDAGAVYRFRLSLKDMAVLWKRRTNLWLVLNFIDVIPGAVIIFLIFKYMEDVHNMGATVVNGLVLAVFTAGAAGALVFGRLGDIWFRRERRARVFVAFACNIVPIVFMFVFLRADFRLIDGTTLAAALSLPAVRLLGLAVAAAVFINQGVNPNWYGTLTDVNLPEHRATMVSLATVMDMAGNAIGPLAAAFIASQSGVESAMGSVLGFWALNAFLWIPVILYVRRDLESVRQTLEKRAAALETEAATTNPDTQSVFPT